MARDFQDSGDNLTVSAAPITGAPFTVSCWVLPDDGTAALHIWSIGDSATDDESEFRLELQGFVAGDPFRLVVKEVGETEQRAATAGTTTLNAWNHVLCVAASATDRKIYRNGANEGTNTVSRTPPTIDLTRIGTRARLTANGNFSGRIAEVAMWNVELTANERTALANGVAAIRIRSASLKFYAPIFGGASPEPDYTANGNSMTVNGTTVVDHPPVMPPFGIEVGLPFPTAAVGVIPPRSIPRAVMRGVTRAVA